MPINPIALKLSEGNCEIHKDREMSESGLIVGGITSLPEGCISNVMSLTSPVDSCRSALVSTTFRSAAESDTVWEKFLPADYREILSRAVDPVEFSTKRDLYFRLCDPILIDGGKMSFALDRSSGVKCYTISARELSITWGDTPDYWRWTTHPDSRFSEVAELLNVCWLEIHGKIDSRALSPKTLYAAFLIFKTVDESYGLNFPNQEASVKVGAHVSTHEVCLEVDKDATERIQATYQGFFNWRRFVASPSPEEEENLGMSKATCARNDGWFEVELGEFFNDDGEDGDVDISLMETKRGNWKSGLIIFGMEVRPKKLAHMELA